MYVLKKRKESIRSRWENERFLKISSLDPRISPFKWNVSGNLTREFLCLEWYNFALTVSFGSAGIKFFPRFQRCTCKEWSRTFRLLSRIRACICTHIYTCEYTIARVLMVSRNGVASRRQFSLFFTTVSFIPLYSLSSLLVPCNQYPQHSFFPSSLPSRDLLRYLRLVCLHLFSSISPSLYVDLPSRGISFLLCIHNFLFLRSSPAFISFLFFFFFFFFRRGESKSMTATRKNLTLSGVDSRFLGYF